MCYVAPSEDTSGDDAARGALVTVTSAGRVSVWSVPSLESVGEKEGGEAVAGTLDIPLLATHAVKVCVQREENMLCFVSGSFSCGVG